MYFYKSLLSCHSIANILPYLIINNYEKVKEETNETKYFDL